MKTRREKNRITTNGWILFRNVLLYNTFRQGFSSRQPDFSLKILFLKIEEKSKTKIYCAGVHFQFLVKLEVKTETTQFVCVNILSKIFRTSFCFLYLNLNISKEICYFNDLLIHLQGELKLRENLFISLKMVVAQNPQKSRTWNFIIIYKPK